jgi:uncharacterized cofD-like protein
MNRWLRWFLPGMKVKRWLALLLVGALSAGIGIYILFSVNLQLLNINLQELVFRITGARWGQYLGILLLIVGLAGLIYGLNRIFVAMKLTLLPDATPHLADLFYQKRQQRRGPKVVVLGGGSGLSMLLRGLKRYTGNLTAVVTVSDDGGSSGILREEMGAIPPGDIRNCILAMANAEPSLQRLFNYRFQEGRMAGHNFGNLFLTAMTSVNDGNFEKAIQETSKVLSVVGEVYPATLEPVTLVAETCNGELIFGESNIGHSHDKICNLRLEPPMVQPMIEVLRAIAEADAIIMGPGSLYTSILPNLLVQGIAEAIAQSPALNIYVVNVMCQPGETENFSASDHVKIINEYLGIGVLDYVLVNSGLVAPDWRDKYSQTGGNPVINDRDILQKMGIKVHENDYVKYQDYVRHDEDVLAKDLIELIIAEKMTLQQRRELSYSLQREHSED